MGEAHGLDIQGCSQVLAEITSIGKIRIRQNGSTVIFYQGFIDFFEPHSSHRKHKTKAYRQSECLQSQFVLIE